MMDARKYLAVFGLAAAGCNEITDVAARSRTDAWQQSPTDQVDILFVVDNSGSMQVEQELLADGFDSFISAIEPTGADFQLGVITTDFVYSDSNRGRLIGDPPIISKQTPNYQNLFKQRVQVGVLGNGKEKGLEAAAWALSPSMATGANAGFLRADATLLVAVVSDEDDCSDDGRLGDADNTACYTQFEDLVPVEEYVGQLQALKDRRDRVKFASIVGPENATAQCGETTYPGYRYIEASRLTAGLTASICDTDWSAFMGELGLNAASLFTVFELSFAANVDTLEVYVDDVQIELDPVDGFTYDEEAHTITFHGASIPGRGADIVAKYEIASGV